MLPSLFHSLQLGNIRRPSMKGIEPVLVIYLLVRSDRKTQDQGTYGDLQNVLGRKCVINEVWKGTAEQKQDGLDH
jgi:hypothetical protein